MTEPDSQTPTAKSVIGYRDGEPFPFEVLDVECGHYLAKEFVSQAKAAIQAAREDGIEVSINSAFRTMERQTELYEAHEKDPVHFAPADKPGYSKHQQGKSLDLHFPGGAADRERFAALAVAHGLERTHPAEPWHFDVSPLKEEVA